MPNDRGPMVLFVTQSNGIIPGNTGPAPYVPTWRVQIWTDTNGDGIGDTFHAMRPGVNTGTLKNPTSWGPEVGFATKWLEANPVKDANNILWIGKAGRGETGMAYNPDRPDFSPRSEGDMFDFAVSTSLRMQSDLGYDHLSLLVIHQGETDAYQLDTAQAYEFNFTEFLDASRVEMRVEDIVVGRINDTAPHSQLVREAQWRIDQEDPHLVSYKTIGFGLQEDRIHHNADGALSLGRADYEGWLIL